MNTFNLVYRELLFIKELQILDIITHISNKIVIGWSLMILTLFHLISIVNLLILIILGMAYEAFGGDELVKNI
jgi:hypothetical protein